MSTSIKRTAADAMADAMHFQRLFSGCYERWEIAGSLRRRKPEIGDCEHVVIPRWGAVSSGGLFGGETSKVNLLWKRCDELLSEWTIKKHVYPVHKADGTETTRTMWGDSYRGIEFHGFNHEIFCADESNWGCILTIRTGPADFSKAIVTSLLSGGMYRQSGGYLVAVKSGERVNVPDEATFFRFARTKYLEPEQRA